MPTMRRSPKGMTTRGTPYSSFHADMLDRFGDRWWTNKSTRRLVAIEAAKRRGIKGNLGRQGVVTGSVGVSFKIDFRELDHRLRKLPEKMALRIQRRGMRKGLVVWAGVIRSLFARHRSDYARPHLADHVAVVSRVYRRHRSRLIWGGVGIRKGAASSTQLNRAVAATVAQGVDSRGTMRRLFGGSSAYFRELPGWRLHFLEFGTHSNYGNGVQAFPRAMDMAGGRVADVMHAEVARLVSEVTK